MLKNKDDLSWYARRADSARKNGERPAAENPDRERRIEKLLAALERDGIRGSIETRTLFTRSLPPGCRGCLSGKGTNLYVTGQCTRDCFFCFNMKPRADEIVVHGIKIQEPEEAAQIVTRFGLRSIGISGGEPLMHPERVLRLLRALRALPQKLRIDLYSNGDLATDGLLRELKDAGLDAIRFNLVANAYNTAPAERALRVFDEVAVEIPVVPSEMTQLKALVLRLDEIGVPYLNIHELFSCAENDARVEKEGYTQRGKNGKDSPLMWRPVEDGEEAALRLLLFALRGTNRLSTYYCSCRTQETISARGLRRRRRLPPA